MTKIHRGITFKQVAWMSLWIDGNTDRRARADNDFERDVFKLANNACFGKTMAGVRGRMDMRLVNASEDDNYD